MVLFYSGVAEYPDYDQADTGLQPGNFEGVSGAGGTVVFLTSPASALAVNHLKRQRMRHRVWSERFVTTEQ